MPFHICSQTILSNDAVILVLFLSFSSVSFEWTQTGNIMASGHHGPSFSLLWLLLAPWCIFGVPLGFPHTTTTLFRQGL